MSSVWAEGNYAALVVTLPVPREVADGLVPEGVGLAEQTLTPQGQHPLLLMFGHHTGVHPAFLKIHGWSYHEFLVAVPWVRRGGSSEIDSTMPRLYLNNLPMVLAGWLYAFPKMLARVKSTDTTYEVRSLLAGWRIIEASWQTDGLAGPVSSQPNFTGVEPSFEQPFLQRFPPLPFERSLMTFDLASAVIQPAAASVTITQPFLPGLPTGQQSFEPLSSTPLGAFTIDVPWTLSPPKFLL